MQDLLNRPECNAFVLGNGISRLLVDHTCLKSFGTVYGCNALYREFDPDHLIAVDAKMVNEIVASKYHLSQKVWTNQNRGITNTQGLRFLSPHRGWSSGPTAIWLACTHGFNNIFMLGFDYHGINGLLNNVYADTHNYKSSAEPATYHGNWLNQTVKVIQENPSVNFFRVVETVSIVPDSFAVLGNLQHITVEQFKDFFKMAQKPAI